MRKEPFEFLIFEYPFRFCCLIDRTVRTPSGACRSRSAFFIAAGRENTSPTVRLTIHLEDRPAGCAEDDARIMCYMNLIFQTCDVKFKFEAVSLGIKPGQTKLVHNFVYSRSKPNIGEIHCFNSFIGSLKLLKHQTSSYILKFNLKTMPQTARSYRVKPRPTRG